MTVLGDFTGGTVFDEVNTLTVNVGEGVLASATRDALLANIATNALLVGAEIIQFRDAALQSPGVYRLSGLLRGLRGTEWAMGGHVVGERVVLLQTTGLRRVPDAVPDIGASRYFKAVTFGKSRASTAAQTFTDTGVSLKPFSPVDLRIANAGGDLNATWLRRTRLSTSFNGFVVPLGEASEEYAVSVINTAGAVIRRTLVSKPSFLYTKAMQLADGISSTGSIAVRVAQRSSVVGDGYPVQIGVPIATVARPQIATITLTGTYSAGVPLYLQIGSNTINHTTTVGEASLSGVATALAAQIDALPDYTATSAGAVITVTGPSAVTYEVSAGVTGAAAFSTYLIQEAAPVGPGSSKKIRLVLMPASIGASSWAAKAGAAFQVTAERGPQGAVDRSVTQTIAAQGGESALTIVSKLTGMPFVSSDGGPPGYFWDYIDGFANFPYAVFTRGETQWRLTTWTTQDDAQFFTGNLDAGSPIVTVPRPQIVDFVLVGFSGTPTVGSTFRAVVGGTAFDYTVGSGDTYANVVAGLAAVIDASASYAATVPTGTAWPSIRVTGLPEVPFTSTGELIAGSIKPVVGTPTQTASYDDVARDVSQGSFRLLAANDGFVVSEDIRLSTGMTTTRARFISSANGATFAEVAGGNPGNIRLYGLRAPGRGGQLSNFGLFAPGESAGYAHVDRTLVSAPEMRFQLAASRDSVPTQVAQSTFSWTPDGMPYVMATTATGYRVLQAQTGKVYDSTNLATWTLVGTISGTGLPDYKPTLTYGINFISWNPAPWMGRFASKWLMLFTGGPYFETAGGSHSDAFICYSTDGVSGWTRAASADVAGQSFVDHLAVGPSKAVAMSVKDGKVRLISSTDGVTWTQEYYDFVPGSVNANAPRWVVPLGSGFVAYCSTSSGNPTFCLKTNGSGTWTVAAAGITGIVDGPTEGLAQITSNGSRILIADANLLPDFVGGAPRMTLRYSDDGTTFTDCTLPAP